jgi:two-component system chemotaxis sensor kinase CheA
MGSLSDDNLITEFVTESREHLSTIEPDLLVMEQQGGKTSQEVINRVFRAIHSIKGGAGFFAFESVKSLSHIMESVLMQVRDRSMAVTPDLMDALFASLDRLRAMLEDIQASEGVPIAAEMARLKAILEGGGVTVGSRVKAHLEGEKGNRQFDLDAESVRSAIKRGMTLFHAKANLHKDLDAHWESPLAFIKNAVTVGQVLNTFLDISSIGSLDNCLEQDLCVTVQFATVLEPDLLALAFKLPSEQIERMDMVALKAALPPRPGRAPAQVPEPEPQPAIPEEASRPVEERAENGGEGTAGKGSKDAGTDTLRVRVDLLTRLMNLAGELVLGRNQLLRTMSPHAQSFPGLADILQNINQVTTELQEAAMQTRMQPIGSLFNRYPRIIRDLSRQMGKRIEVEIRGAEVELDKSIVELLADPLTHLIRNCADHAIEAPEERKRVGKDPTGRMVLNAYHEGGQVNIAIEDDGRGIDPQRMARKAVEKGLITPAQAEALSERERVNLVFVPGFSTVEQVSQLSGRGVGMDVVRTNVEKLGGTVELDTQTGMGTSVRLRLPLTLAILPSMIVGVQGQRFAIPQVDVVELVWIRAAEVKTRVERVQGAEVLRLRDKLLPLVRLADVLGISRSFQPPGSDADLPDRRVALADRRGPTGETPTSGGAGRRDQAERRQAWRGDYHVVVLQIGGNQYGIVVDDLHDFEEIVVKPVSKFLEGLACFSGTTILGDGRVILILDSAGLAAQAKLHFSDLQAEERRRQEEQQRRLALQTSRRQSVILFESGRGERFAVAQDKVLRLEQIRTSSIERMGAREYIEYRGDSLPLIRLDQHLAVSPLDTDAEELYLVIPNSEDVSGRTSGGILIANIIDALDVEAELKPVEIHGPGLLGSAVLQGHMTLFLDPIQVALAATGGRRP